MPDVPGVLSPSARSPHVGVWCGAQNSHFCRWVSVNQLVFSLWSFPPWRYVVVYITKLPLLPLDVASSFSSGVGYLFESFWSIWLKIAQHLVVILLFLGEKLNSSPSILPSYSCLQLCLFWKRVYSNLWIWYAHQWTYIFWVYNLKIIYFFVFTNCTILL